MGNPTLTGGPHTVFDDCTRMLQSSVADTQWFPSRTQDSLRQLTVAGSISILSVLFAGTSHTIGGGEPPAPMVLAISALFGTMLAMPLAARRLTRARIAGIVLAAQATLHLLFQAVGGHASIQATASQQLGHHAHEAVSLTASAAHAHGLAPSPGMLVAHLIAAVAAYLLVRHGVDGWRCLYRLTLGRLTRLARLALTAIPHAARIAFAEPVLGVAHRIGRARIPRAPPLAWA